MTSFVQCISSRQYIFFYRLRLSFLSYDFRKGSALLLLWLVLGRALVLESKERTLQSNFSVTPQAYSYIQQRQRVGTRKSGKTENDS
jgi:hypothetical protein